MVKREDNVVSGAIQKAIAYLHQEQLPWGEFLTYSFLVDKNGSYGLSPFATTFVLHALSFVPQTLQVKEMRSKGVKFLLEQREEAGIWRYYGKNVDLAPDVDDTACALAALAENGIEVGHDATEALLESRDPETGLFRTWLGTSPVLLENDVDSVVNANVLFYFGLLRQSDRVPEVAKYLVQESSKLHMSNSQVWYYSPYVLAYAVSRAYADGDVQSLEQAGEHIRRFLLFAQDEDGGWRNHLDTACALISLLNFRCWVHTTEKAVAYLLDEQNEDGSWNEAMFNFPFASREITTALCVEGLSKIVFRPG